MSGSEDLDLLIAYREASQRFIAAKSVRGTSDFNEDEYQASKKAVDELRTYWRQIREYLSAPSVEPVEAEVEV